jgi:hypothetical protein
MGERTQDPVGRKSRRGEMPATLPRLDRAGFEPCVRLASPKIGSFSGLSKPSGVVHPRSGSKPARNSFSGYPHPRRAEFFAPPGLGSHFRPFAFWLLTDYCPTDY